MTKLIHFLIPGHGGINALGQYTTCPKYDINDPKTWHKMHVHHGSTDKPLVVYEGVLNRSIVENIIIHANLAGITVNNLVTEFEDISLQERVSRLRNWTEHYKKFNKKCVLWEIHNNAFDGNAEGFEIFSSTRTNFSDKMADVWIEEMENQFGDMKNRGHKEKDFYVIQNSPVYSVLCEIGFFDNYKEIQRLYNCVGYKKIAKAFIESMKRVEEIYPA